MYKVLSEFGLLIEVAILIAAYALYPTGFLDTPFGQMTPNMLFRFVGAIAICVIGFGGLLFIAISSPHEND